MNRKKIIRPTLWVEQLEDRTLPSGVLPRPVTPAQGLQRVYQWGLGLLAAACLMVGIGYLAAGQFLEKPEKSKPKEMPKSQIKEEDLFKIERLLEISKLFDGRKNGVLLQAKVEVKKRRGGEIILIHWSIDYAGPRFPLHILEPWWYGQTSVELFPVDEKGIAHPVTIHPKLPFSARDFLVPNKEDFLTVNRGEVADGTIEVPLREAGARKIQSGKVIIPPGRLFVQLVHTPSERGEHLSLDAWTGSLQTQMIPVPIEKPEKK